MNYDDCSTGLIMRRLLVDFVESNLECSQHFTYVEHPPFSIFCFVVVYLGCTSTSPVGVWFYVQEHPKAHSAVILVFKRLRRRGNGLKSQPTDWEKPGIEPATPGLQDIGLSPTQRRLHFSINT